MNVVGGMSGQMTMPAPEIEDLSPAIVRVSMAPSMRWIRLLIAGLAAVVCLGVAGGEPSTGRSPASIAAAVTLASPPSVAPPRVAATARILTMDGIARAVVSGAASSGVDRVEVSLLLGGRVVATADAIPGAAGPDHDPFAPWSAVLDVPSEDLPSDAQVILDVAWSARGEPLGSFSLALALGDGRHGEGDR